MKPARFIVTVYVLSMLLVSAQVALAQKEPIKGLDAYINKALKDWEVPGLAIAIVKDDKVVYAKGYGVQKLGESTPVNERTIFAVGSTTKAMTVACLGMLVDEKKISWDDAATKHLKGFQLYDPYVTRELTVRDLVTHRSGLERGDALWHLSPYSREEVLFRIRHLKPAWSFRSRYGYQNIMYLAAGQIIPEVAGKSWDEFIQERLFTPLGMTSTTTSTKQLEGIPNVATPHGVIDDKVQPISWVNIDNVAPAGSVNSNAVDMAQWIRLNLNEGVVDGKRLLSKETVEEMQTPQTIIRLDSLTKVLRPSTHFSAYGLGWVLNDYLGRKIVLHGGAIHGMRARVLLVPEEKLGIVTLINSTRDAVQHGVVFWVLDAYLNAKPRDWSAEYLKNQKTVEERAKAARKKREEERVKDTKPSLAQGLYVGTYTHEMYGDVTVSEQDGKLVMRFYPGLEGDMEHWHHDTFRVLWRDRTLGDGFVTFTLNVAGKVEWLKGDGLADFKKSN
jgi:CubicO group peptidase (beta-lactamase class C family)